MIVFFRKLRFGRIKRLGRTIMIGIKRVRMHAQHISSRVLSNVNKWWLRGKSGLIDLQANGRRGRQFSARRDFCSRHRGVPGPSVRCNRIADRSIHLRIKIRPFRDVPAQPMRTEPCTLAHFFPPVDTGFSGPVRTPK